MPTDSDSNPSSAFIGAKRRSWSAALAWLMIGGLVLYVLVAYLLLPLRWRSYERRHPALDDAPRVTHTKTGIPGDPLNLALLASVDDLHHAAIRGGRMGD